MNTRAVRSSLKKPAKSPPSGMPTLRSYNTLTRQREEFAPLDAGRVKVYTCGPTVYRNAHIGNMRSYLMADWLRRFLEAQGFSVTHVKNITDVGHMREDLLDRGEDKVIAAARAEGKTPAQIAAYYTEAFLKDEESLNILPASIFPRATSAVEQMVTLIEKLVEKGYAYESSGNVYFEVGRFAGYGKLSRQQAEGLEDSGRAAPDPLKRDQRDFALWKAAEPGRGLKWKSPWGEGFPGWHIECSAIGEHFLGRQIDFHTGGVDNIFPHHEDEIAQSEAAFGQQHVKSWMHGQHLLVDGLKMAKSTGNVYLVSDLEARGFDPLAFRYLCATAHYRARLNFTLASLRAAQRGLDRLRGHLHEPEGRISARARASGEKLRSAFWVAAANDLNVPGALAVAWRVARSKLPGGVKRELLLDFDRLLGLDLARPATPAAVPADITRLLRERHSARLAREYAEADQIREQILNLGYRLRDLNHRSSIAVPVPEWEQEDSGISSSEDVESLLEDQPDLEWTVSVVARRGCEELDRCIASVKRWLGERPSELIVVNNGFEESCNVFVDDLTRDDERLKVFRADHFLGSAAARNVSLRQARGRYVVFVDTSVELTGDIFDSVERILADSTVGVAGKWGVVTDDLRTFEESPAPGEVHAVEGYLMAFRRDVLREVGFLDEKFRFYRHLDLDFSFAVRSRGYRAVIDTDLPLKKHRHVDWEATPEEERDRLSKRNFYRFLHKWGERTDLINVRS
jgi:cysteinyl-tRNA synthetase